MNTKKIFSDENLIRVFIIYMIISFFGDIATTSIGLTLAGSIDYEQNKEAKELMHKHGMMLGMLLYKIPIAIIIIACFGFAYRIYQDLKKDQKKSKFDMFGYRLLQFSLWFVITYHFTNAILLCFFNSIFIAQWI